MSKPCPGRVVLMTSRAISDDLITLTLRGTAEGITATSTHPVYSEDRSAFVPVGSLAIGERVRTADGWAPVESLGHSCPFGSHAQWLRFARAGHGFSQGGVVRATRHRGL